MKILLFVLLFSGCATFVFSQVGRRPVLAILPFTGGTEGAGEAIATLLSFQPDILGTFTVVPRDARLNAIFAEHEFQLTGLTDADTIAGIGHMLNAEYVLSGNIRQLGDRNLVIATIVNVGTFEQVAGYHLTYRTIEEVRCFLPSMSRNMVASVLQDTSGLPNLAILPLEIAGINAHDAETLAKILAIEILDTGSYTVLPRTSAIESARREQDFQMWGYTDDEGAVSLGQAFNAQFVLSIGVNSLGAINMFTAQILHVRDGSLLAGASRDYRVVTDGIHIMWEIATLLTDPDGAARRIRRQKLFGDSARFWSMAVSVGTSFTAPWVVGTLQGTLAPLRHSFIRIGCDVGFISGMKGVTGYYLVYPFIHIAFFMPLDGLTRLIANGGWYIGFGGGVMFEEYQFDVFDIRRWGTPMMDFIMGLVVGVGRTNRGHMFDISFAMRTNDFSSAARKLSFGYVYRFQTRRR